MKNTSAITWSVSSGVTIQRNVAYGGEPRFCIKKSQPNIFDVELATLFLSTVLPNDPGFRHFLLLRCQEFRTFGTIWEEEPGDGSCQDGGNAFDEEQ